MWNLDWTRWKNFKIYILVRDARDLAVENSCKHILHHQQVRAQQQTTGANPTSTWRGWAPNVLLGGWSWDTLEKSTKLWLQTRPLSTTPTKMVQETGLEYWIKMTVQIPVETHASLSVCLHIVIHISKKHETLNTEHSTTNTPDTTKSIAKRNRPKQAHAINIVFLSETKSWKEEHSLKKNPWKILCSWSNFYTGMIRTTFFDAKATQKPKSITLATKIFANRDAQINCFLKQIKCLKFFLNK